MNCPNQIETLTQLLWIEKKNIYKKNLDWTNIWIDLNNSVGLSNQLLTFFAKFAAQTWVLDSIECTHIHMVRKILPTIAHRTYFMQKLQLSGIKTCLVSVLRISLLATQLTFKTVRFERKKRKRIEKSYQPFMYALSIARTHIKCVAKTINFVNCA